MIRAVVDTNLIISGLFWRGNPAQVYDSAAKGIYVLLTTTDLIDELDRVLRVLTAYQNIPILDTAQFVKRLEE
jgi:predicted nucleic acid-binding protein